MFREPLLSYCAGLGEKAKLLVGINWYYFFDFTQTEFILQESRIFSQTCYLLNI